MPEPLGLAAFDSLRAEDEPWLADCFVPPPDFDLMAGARSAIIFGEVGSGKTAVRQALTRRASPPGEKPTKLLVEWFPVPPIPGTPADSYSVRTQLMEVLDACALAVLQHLAHYPADFGTAPDWARKTLVWFVRRHLQGEFTARIGRLAAEAGETGEQLLRDLSARWVHDVLYPDASPELVITEFTKALKTFGLDSTWVVVDGLGTWIGADLDRLASELHAFLSALSLFERAGFAYKMLLPTELKGPLSSAGGIARRRVDMYRLEWTIPRLVAMAEKRLALATGRQVTQLTDLCEAPGWTTWLERCGGLAPRGWLEYVRPLVPAYLELTRQGKARPLNTAEWEEIRRRHPPPLFLDDASQHVVVGWREVDDVPPGAYTLLRYMYEKPGKICSKSELYYIAYRGLDTEPRSPSDTDWEPPASYAGVIDTIIWRLRQAIEPVPDDPLLVVTVRGQGARLDNIW